MSDKLKLLPAFVMLLAGATTSIITFCVNYSMKSALIILLVVLVVFYIIGLVFQKIIYSFEKENDKKEKERLEAERLAEEQQAEGTIVEKDENKMANQEEVEQSGRSVGSRPSID